MHAALKSLTGDLNLASAANRKYAKGLGRLLAGAILFSMPILMTMEMWWLGFYLSPLRIVQFVVVNFIVLVGLSRVSGFEETQSIGDDILDALAAYAVAALWSAAILALLGIITSSMEAGEIIGKITIETIPASFGAMVAAKQLGRDEGEEDMSEAEERTRATYWGQLFLMLAGALFLSFSVAPTEEMILISFLMDGWHVIALIFISIMMLHTLVYTVGLKGEETPSGPTSFWSILLRFSIAGYAIALVASFYVLWTFGRVDDTGVAQVIDMVVVLAFPGAIGAALARLVV